MESEQCSLKQQQSSYFGKQKQEGDRCTCQNGFGLGGKKWTHFAWILSIFPTVLEEYSQLQRTEKAEIQLDLEVGQKQWPNKTGTWDHQ